MPLRDLGHNHLIRCHLPDAILHSMSPVIVAADKAAEIEFTAKVKSIDDFLKDVANSEWVANVTSGQYRQWVGKQYGA